MTTITLTPAEIELIELKRSQEQLLAEQKLIEDKIKYQKLVERANQEMTRLVNISNMKYNRINSLYKLLVKEGVGEYITLVNLDKNIVSCPNYLVADLKDVDKPTPVEVDALKIKIGEFGTIYDVDTELKAHLPHSLSSRYQAYTYKTIAKKIKEAVDQLKIDNIQKIKLNNAFNTLKEYFLSLDPNCDVTEVKEYNHTHKLYFDYLKVVFSNTSWMKISYYSDGSWSVKDKFDHKAPKDKFELANYLAK
jgi:hypothetical protein